VEYAGGPGQLDWSFDGDLVGSNHDVLRRTADGTVWVATFNCSITADSFDDQLTNIVNDALANASTSYTLVYDAPVSPGPNNLSLRLDGTNEDLFDNATLVATGILDNVTN